MQLFPLIPGALGRHNLTANSPLAGPTNFSFEGFQSTHVKRF